MTTVRNHITVFEHQTIKLNEIVSGIQFCGDKLKALQSYYGENGVPYFSLTHNGIRFNEYVGVIQVGNLLIEVLPKADKARSSKIEELKWRNMLIGMLRAVHGFDIIATSDSTLKIKPNTILDLYFAFFIKEVEFLLHTGLVKKYRQRAGNVTSLKGNLIFGKHIQQNCTHGERFYVRHTVYDVRHLLHIILFKTLNLLKKINSDSKLQSSIGSLLLSFPPMPDIKVSETSFSKITYNRKTLRYKAAIDIAKLLLLQYHPDVSRGRNNVLALMFDMNKLWEAFVYKSLQKSKTLQVTAQTSKDFWKPEHGYRSVVRPDIVINKGDPKNCIVLDTKWKNLNGFNPSPDDLRQLYVYHEYYEAKKVALVYPGTERLPVRGNYLKPTDGNIMLDKECSIISLPVLQDIKKWQLDICSTIINWMTKSVNTP